MGRLDERLLLQWGTALAVILACHKTPKAQLERLYTLAVDRGATIGRLKLFILYQAARGLWHGRAARLAYEALEWLEKHNPDYDDILEALVYTKWAYEAIRQDMRACPAFHRASFEKIMEKALDVLREIARSLR